MYRRKEEIIEALVSGKSNSHSIRTQISKYRKKKDLLTLLMFQSAIEEYNMFYRVTDDG
tara:strand:+ start:1060 stop:1236 length:177 start_codon:yes stop_codon:yes gene_type:complete